MGVDVQGHDGCEGAAQPAWATRGNSAVRRVAVLPHAKRCGPGVAHDPD